MPANKIKVLKFLSNFNIGGTERQFLHLVQRMDRDRFDVHVACFSSAGKFFPLIQECQVPFHEFHIRRLYSPATWLRLLKFASYLRKQKFQVVHSYGFHPNVFVVPAARLAGIPVVIASIRDTGEVLAPSKRRLQKAVCRFASCVLGNAEAVREQLKRDGYNQNRLAVIRNGIVLRPVERRESVGPLRSEFGFAADTPIVAVLARLNELKGIQYFLDALPEVLARFPQVRVLIVGDGIGRGRTALEEHASRLKLGSSVIFTGFRLDVPELLKEVTISVLPSLSEGLSNVLIESMAAGVPVVATRVGGTPEIVEEGVTGILVPSHDSAALSRSIATLLENPERAARMGRAGRERIEEKFSLDRAVRETEKLYMSLLGAEKSLALQESWT